MVMILMHLLDFYPFYSHCAAKLYASFNISLSSFYFCQCLKELKRKYLEKEDRYRSLASLDEMHTKLEELQKQMAWALVRSFPSNWNFPNFYLLHCFPFAYLLKISCMISNLIVLQSYCTAV